MVQRSLEEQAVPKCQINTLLCTNGSKEEFNLIRSDFFSFLYLEILNSILKNVGKTNNSMEK
jgi:hypothetical protein